MVDPKEQAKLEKEANDANAAREQELEVQREADLMMVKGEVALDSPNSNQWPDSVPMQSRYGDPKQLVTPQTIPSTEDKKAAKEEAPKDESPEPKSDKTK